MKTLSANQLDRMRSQVGDILPDTCVIQTSAGTAVDSAGRPSDTWAAAGTVACRVDRMTSGQDQSSVDANREQTEVRYQLTVPYNAPLAANCRVVTGSKTYDVLELVTDHSYRVSIKAIIAQRR